MPALPSISKFILPIVSGIALSFAYPNWNFEAAVWFWLYPLLFILWPFSGSAARSPFLSGYLAGLAFWIPNLAWLRHSSRVIAGARDNAWTGIGPELMGFGAVLGLSLYCALYFGAWAWIAARFAKPNPQKLATGTWQSCTWHSLSSAFIASAAWVGLEWIRGMLFTGFGWNGLGVALHENAVLIQIADGVGVTGLSFLPVFITCTAYNTLTRIVLVYRGEGQCRSRVDFTVAMVLLLSTAGYGMKRLATVEENPVKVRTVLVQPNVAQVDAWSGALGPQVYQRLSDFTHLYAEARDGIDHTDLVIWPESALPIHLHGLADHEPYFNELLDLSDFSLLTGTEIHQEGRIGHVSAVLFRGDYENRQEYHKIHLVPFGEYLPFRDIPPFSFLKGVLPGDFQPGLAAEPLLLAKPEVQIIPLICFEDTVGSLARQFVRPASQMIVNITNDGWFLESSETEVHLANAKFRAIELRRPMVRAANTGVSCFIDVLGNVTSQLSDPATGNTFIEGCLPGEVKIPRVPEMTLYALYGDVFSIVMLIGTLGIVIPQLRRKPKVV